MSLRIFKNSVFSVKTLQDAVHFSEETSGVCKNPQEDYKNSLRSCSVRYGLKTKFENFTICGVGQPGENLLSSTTHS